MQFECIYVFRIRMCQSCSFGVVRCASWRGILYQKFEIFIYLENYFVLLEIYNYLLLLLISQPHNIPFALNLKKKKN